MTCHGWGRAAPVPPDPGVTGQSPHAFAAAVVVSGSPPSATARTTRSQPPARRVTGPSLYGADGGFTAARPEYP
ncbi:hypothetical protein APS67_003023 [Streptomyces sp. AVP053U2]|nr:hypothetical protein APS67_003023 [Streptomyces sp. AVP053U2]